MKIIILGVPKAKQSMRIGYNKSLGRAMSYQSKAITEWSAGAKAQLITQLPSGFIPYDCPVVIANLTFVYPIPKGMPKYKRKMIEEGMDIYKDTKPDLMDNLPKNLFDSCEGILFTNDSKIVQHEGEMKKIYGTRPRIEFGIRPLDP